VIYFLLEFPPGAAGSVEMLVQTYRSAVALHSTSKMQLDSTWEPEHVKTEYCWTNSARRIRASRNAAPRCTRALLERAISAHGRVEAMAEGEL
jgi:hypothetical protein